MKKIISVFLSTIMIFSMGLGVSASSDTYSDQEVAVALSSSIQDGSFTSALNELSDMPDNVLVPIDDAGIKHRNKVALLVVELIMALIVITYFLEPIVRLNLASTGLDTLNQDGLYGVINTTSPDVMFKTFDLSDTRDFFINYYYDDDNQYIMFKYLSNIVDGRQIERRVANHAFFKMFPVQLADGRSFNDWDFKNFDNQAIPILVGYNLRNYYELGSVHEFTSGEDGLIFNAIVIGILSKGSSYPRVATVQEIMDNSYIIPMSKEFIEHYFGYSDFDMAISNTLIRTTGPKTLDVIESEAIKRKLFTFDFVPMTKAIEEVKERVKTITFNYCIKVGIGILIFFIIFISQLAFIRSREKDLN